MKAFRGLKPALHFLGGASDVVCRFLALLVACWSATAVSRADDWPRFRGPGGNAVSSETGLPTTWTETENVRWMSELPGEGSSSPIVWQDRVFVTSALERGIRRVLYCLDRRTGERLWAREITHELPEITSAVTGHAAATPVCDAEHVVAFFGNAGAVCYDHAGQMLWHVELGEFETELGLASSPVLHGDRVILVCDHDGNRFRSFDSFLVALELRTGKVLWKTERPNLFRSWSTPIVVAAGGAHPPELVVNAQDELRAYDPQQGALLWTVRGMTGWVAPSPVFGRGLIFACSGKDGPTLAVRPGGRGDVTESHLAWSDDRGAPYVCSPLLYGEQLYVHNEQGVLTCYDAVTGKISFRQRLDGKFVASGVAGDGKIYLTSEEGATYVLRAGSRFELLAKNELPGECWGSPAISGQSLFLRTRKGLYRCDSAATGTR